MSTNIQPGKMPGIITTNSGPKNAKASGQEALNVRTNNVGAVDTVSMTDNVSRLQKAEKTLASIPVVNDKLVSEIKQSIAAGDLQMDLDRIATELVKMESSTINKGKD